MDLAKIISIYLGELPKSLVKTFFLPIVFGIFSILMISAILYYPHPYSFTADTISNLGNPVLNPFPGWLFFSLAFWYLAFMLPPIFLYLHKRLLHLSKNLARIGTLFNFCSLIGMILLGFFPNLENLLLIHATAASLAFGGAVFGCIFYWVTMIKEAMMKAFKYRHLTIISILFVITILLSLILLLGIIQIIGTSILQLEFPFWEWTLFIILIIQFLIFILIIPENNLFQR
ncbi:MAG: hypothetical protein ACTSYB_10305 [Candidatus Helarchaeota archaeon]